MTTAAFVRTASATVTREWGSTALIVADRTLAVSVTGSDSWRRRTGAVGNTFASSVGWFAAIVLVRWRIQSLLVNELLLAPGRMKKARRDFTVRNSPKSLLVQSIRRKPLGKLDFA